METVGYAALQIIPSMRGTSRAIESELGGALDGVERRGGDSLGSKLLGGVMKWAGRAVLAIGTVGTAVAGLAIKGGIGRALDTEDAIVQMRRMGLETEQVDALVAGVNDTFQGTVFTNPEGFKLAGLLHGANVELADIPDQIGTIADFAAHANVPLDQMGDIFLQVIGQGRVTGNIFNRLTAAGIPLEQIAQGLGMSVAEMRELASSGELTADMFLDAAANAEMFEGAAKAMGSTTRGAFSNIGSWLNILGEALVSPLFGEGGPMVTFFQSVVNVLEAAYPMFEQVGASIGDVLVPVLESAAEWLNTFAEGLGAGGSAAASAGGVIGPILETVGSALQTVWSVVEPVASAFMDALAPAFDQMGGSLGSVVSGLSPIGSLFTALQPVLPQVTDSLVAIAGTLGGALAGILPTIADLLGVVAGVFADVLVAVLPTVAEMIGVIAGLAAELVPPIAEVAQTIVGALSGSLSMILPLLADLALTLVSTLAPILPTIASTIALVADVIAGVLTGAVVAIMPTLVNLVESVFVALTPILPIVASLLATVAEVFGAVMAAVQPLLPPILELVQVLLGALMPLLPALIDLFGVVADVVINLVGALSPLLPTIGNLIGIVLELALTVLTPLIDVIAAVANIIASVLTVVIGALGPIVEAIISVISTFAEILSGLVLGAVKAAGGTFRSIWNAIYSVTMSVWNGIRSVIVGVVNAIGSVVRTVTNTVRGLITNAWRTVSTVTSSAWNAVRNGVANGISAAVSAIRGLPGRARSALSNIGSTLLSAGRNLVSGFISGIRGMAGSVISAITSTITNALPSFVRSALGISSPSRVFRDLGQWVPAGFALGITDGEDEPIDALDSMSDRLLGYDLPTLTVGVELDDRIDPSNLTADSLRAPFVPSPTRTVDEARAADVRDRGRGGNEFNLYEVDDPRSTAATVARVLARQGG